MATDGTQTSSSMFRNQIALANGNENAVNGTNDPHPEDSPARSLGDDLPVDEDDEDDADLFGDGDEGDEPRVTDRKLDDSELDSGDDDGRRDRVAETVEDEEDFDDGSRLRLKIMEGDVGRIQAPEAGDDELYLLNMPSFLGIQHKNYDHATYEPETVNHGAAEPPTGNFSPYNVAATSIFWRHNPRNPAKLQSNSRIVRWSDGSLTLQIASSPKDQYRISASALKQSYGKKQKFHATQDYDPDRDAQLYLAAPHVEASLLQVVAPVSAALKILPTGEQTDESVIQLQKSLAAAGATHDPFASFRRLKEDPELAKKRAELAEKEAQRYARKRELAEEKAVDQKKRVLARSGLSRGVGLSVAGLEDEDGMPTARARASKKPKRKSSNRRGDIYSDDEDENYPRGRTREDEYDMDDKFLAASDEELEIFEDEEEEEEEDPDVDDLDIEGQVTVVPSKSRGERQGTPKRSTAAEEITVAGSPHTRKKRRVIEDDDEDDD